MKYIGMRNVDIFKETDKNGRLGRNCARGVCATVKQLLQIVLLSTAAHAGINRQFFEHPPWMRFLAFCNGYNVFDVSDIISYL